MSVNQSWHAKDGLWRRLGNNPIQPGQKTGKPKVGAAIISQQQSAWEALEAEVGVLAVRRSYAGPNTFPATFAASNAGIDIGRRDSVWSFKPNCVDFAAGVNDAWFSSF